jgi:serine/threonine protein kinase
MRGGEAAIEARPVSGDRRRRPLGERAPGEVIAGKYALRRLLGRGGMGSVWHAKNVTLGTDVAIKLILPTRVLPEAGERLFREARAAARLEHPGIVRVFDFGWSEQREPFIVMELLRGPTLGELLAARLRLPAALAVQLLLPVAGALSFAHARGVVHRDLKPDNVMLVTTPQGAVVPKLVDFGIAKLLHEERPLTREGAILGSPHYMAPEQASGACDVDERADVWSLCVVLYEVVAGFRPFDRPGGHAPLTALFEEPIPLTTVGAGDDALFAILRRGLAADAAARWPSMPALGTALAEWALARRIDVDVTGGRIDQHFRSPATSPTMLELPEPVIPAGSETTEWAALAPAPPGPIETTMAAPAPRALARRLWPVISLALVIAGLALLRTAWMLREDIRAAHAPAVASPAFLPTPPDAPHGESKATPPSASASPEPRGTVSAARTGPPAGAPASAPPRWRGSGMPLPARPSF